MKKNTNGGKPVTLQQLKNFLKPIFAKIDKRFKEIDHRFGEIDHRFDVIETRMEMNDRRFIGLNARIETLEKKVDDLDEKMHEYFMKIYNLIDSFAKRTEDNANEILFLGKQHDDLAKYCTQKIAYPTYGRNL